MNGVMFVLENEYHTFVTQRPGLALSSFILFLPLMTKIEFSAKETASLQAHFAREKERLTAELSHVELMLSKLGL